jgi:hypothetical protein
VPVTVPERITLFDFRVSLPTVGAAILPRLVKVPRPSIAGLEFHQDWPPVKVRKMRPT